MRTLTIAAGCFAPRWHKTAEDLRAEVFARVEDAKADLVIFPEYAAMATALIGAPEGDPEPQVWAARGAEAHHGWIALMQEAAARFKTYILAGSGPARVAGQIVNRAVFCAPDGSIAHQDKQIPTPWERDRMQMVRGDGLTLFDTALGKIGVNICYDAEFPLFARALVAAGAEVILVPSCTDTQAGQDRVQIGSRARALENQCLVVQAPMQGVVQGCDPIADNIGQAGLFGPPDLDQPSGGIHALSAPKTEGWLRRRVDLGRIAQARTGGDVTVFNDWPAQGLPDLPVKIVTLGK